MRPLPALPGSSFRILTLAVLAVVTVGGTVIKFDATPDAAAGKDPMVVDNAAPSTPPITTEPPVEDENDRVSEVTTTLAPTTSVSDLDDADVDAVVTVDDAVLAPVSGVPVLVDDATDRADIELAEPEPDVRDLGDATACAPVELIGEPDSTAVDDAIPAVTAGAATVWFADDFGDGDDGWTPLSGTWAAVDGAYVQSDGQGYDLISQLPIDLPTEYRIAVDMAPLEGALGGGILLGQPVLGSRRGATLVDFTDGGNFIRWGVYDSDTGQYRYTGGLAAGGDFDPRATHRLAIEIRADRTMVVLDGRAVGDFDPIAPGRAGLAASLSAVSFDNIEIVEL